MLLPATPVVRAQEVPVDTVEVPKWNIDVNTRLSGSQAGYQNWTKGGANTLALASEITGKASRSSLRWEQKHDIRLGFGVLKQDTLAFRKADDLIDINSSVQYHGDSFFRHFNPTVASQIRTQFAPGFNYKKNPFGDERKPPVKVSDFFSPVSFTQSIGLTYDPAEWFTQRLGIGTKETVVLIRRFRELYGLKPDSVVHFELGVESRSRFEKEIFENVRVRSSLGLFAAFHRSDLPDLLWENLLAMQVNSWLGVNLQFDAMYDPDLSEALQLKEVLSLGVSFAII